MRYLFVGIAGGLAAVARYSASVAVGVRGFPQRNTRCQRDRLLLVRSVCSARGRRAHSSRHWHCRNGRLPRGIHHFRDLWLGELLTHPNPSSRSRGDLCRCVGLSQLGCGRRRMACRKNFRPLALATSLAGWLDLMPSWLAGWSGFYISLSPYRELPSRLTAHPDTLSSTFVRGLATEKPCYCLARHHEVGRERRKRKRRPNRGDTPGQRRRRPAEATGASAHEPGPARPAFEKGSGRESTGGGERPPRSPTWRRRGWW